MGGASNNVSLGHGRKSLAGAGGRGKGLVEKEEARDWRGHEWRHRSGMDEFGRMGERWQQQQGESKRQ